MLLRRLLGQDLNIVNIIAMPILVGVGVDNGIFLVATASRRPQPGHTHPPSSDDHAGEHFRGRGELAATAHAVTLANLNTILGFGSLVFTSTPAIRSLGLVLGVGMTACWVGTVFLLGPILLRMNDGEHRWVVGQSEMM